MKVPDEATSSVRDAKITILLLPQHLSSDDFQVFLAF